MPSTMRRALRPANQVAGRAPNCPLNGLMQKPQRARLRAPLCLLASAVATAKLRLRHVAKAGRRRIVEALRALAAKKRWVHAVAKKRTASLRRHRVGALHTAVVPVRVTEAVTRAVATQVAVQDSAILAQAAREQPEARRAAVAATAATHPPVVRALVAVAVAVTTATAAVLAAVATAAVAVDTTVAARVAVKAAAMVAAATAVRAQARRAHAGVIAVSRHLMDAAVAARAEAMAEVAPVAQAAATEIAAVEVVVDSLATVARHQPVAASALAAAQVIVMASPGSQAASRAAARARAAAHQRRARVGAWADRLAKAKECLRCVRTANAAIKICRTNRPRRVFALSSARFVPIA